MLHPSCSVPYSILQNNLSQRHPAAKREHQHATCYATECGRLAHLALPLFHGVNVNAPHLRREVFVRIGAGSRAIKLLDIPREPREYARLNTRPVSSHERAALGRLQARPQEDVDL